MEKYLLVDCVYCYIQSQFRQVLGDEILRTLSHFWPLSSMDYGSVTKKLRHMYRPLENQPNDQPTKGRTLRAIRKSKSYS